MLGFFANLPCIDLPIQEPDRHNFNTYPTIFFHVYQLISHSKIHVRRPFDEETFCHFFLCDPSSLPPAKIYTKNIVMMETSIAGFHTSFLIPKI